MEDSWASEIAFDELLKNPQHSLTITRTCAINNLWGYELIHRYKEPESRMGYTFAKNMKITPASVRAKKLNGKYVLLTLENPRFSRPQKSKRFFRETNYGKNKNGWLFFRV